MASLNEVIEKFNVNIIEEKKEIWAHYLIWKDYELFKIILKEWRKNLPPQSILKDLKKTLNVSRKIDVVPILLIPCYVLINDEEFIRNLIYFGADIDMINFEGYRQIKFIDNAQSDNYLGVMTLRKVLKEANAARIIVRAAKRALDDEKELTLLRKKIDLRKFLDILEEDPSFNS
jgi:hypothetical protein